MEQTGCFNAFPTHISNYQLLVALERPFEGTSAVFRAINYQTYGKVAIKIIRHHEDMDFDFSGYDILTTLSYSHIIQVHTIQIYLETNQPEFPDLYSIIVMPEASSGDLYFRIVENGALKEADVTKLAYALLNALDHMHKQDYLHNQIRPENILLKNEPGEEIFPLLSGFSKAMKEEDKIPLDRKAQLFEEYAAPELRDENYESIPTQQTDIYSLGVTLYNVATGFSLESVNNRYTIPAWNLLSEQMKDLIMTMISKNPNDRLNCEILLSHEVFTDLRASREKSQTELEVSDQLRRIQAIHELADEILGDEDCIY